MATVATMRVSVTLPIIVSMTMGVTMRMIMTMRMIVTVAASPPMRTGTMGMARTCTGPAPA